MHLFSIMHGDLDDDDRLAGSGVRIMRYVDQVHEGGIPLAESLRLLRDSKIP